MRQPVAAMFCIGCAFGAGCDMNTADICPILMSTQYKTASTAAAVDTRYAFVLVLQK